MSDKAQLSTRLKVLAAIAMADGSLDDKERRLLESICEDLGLDREDLKDAIEQRKAVRTEDLPAAPEEKRALLIDVFRVAAADGKVEPREEQLARNVAKALGLSGADVRDCIRAAQQSFEEKPARPTTPAEVTYTAEESVPAVWQVGDVILDLYEVKHVHHSGGMGLVYRVHHKDWNLDLAVKSPRPQSFKSERQKENFERECETWIDLGLHPHIVSCYYVRRLGGIPRVFAEYVEGGSLKDWIDDRRLYEGGHEQALERILDIAIQSSWGLHYAHDKGLVHQDVKPGNVMMTLDGTAKVTDFGLARAGRATDDQNHDDSPPSVLVTRKGMTPAYCSPEQANGDKLSPVTDLWSWAVSVLEMFTGEVTWPAGQVAGEALENRLEMNPEDRAIPAMPEKLPALLRTCLQQNTAERPESLEVVATALRGIYADATGNEFTREEPAPAELLADALNNKAISLLDLGRTEANQKRAEALYDEALTADPHHPEATYNRGLLLWHTGRMTDDELVRQLEEVRTSHDDEWRDEYLLGLVHIERGDAESAVRLLEQASETCNGDSEVQSALDVARGGDWGRCVRTFVDRNKWVKSVAVSTDGRWALSGISDLTHSRKSDYALRFWDLLRGGCLRKLEGHTGHVYCVAFSTDARWGLSGSADTTLRLWDVHTGECLRTYEGHTNQVTSVVFSPDSLWALSGSLDKTMRLWDVRTGECQYARDEHSSRVDSVAFSPDGRHALSGTGSMESSVRLWDVRTGKCVRTFKGHSDGVTSVAFSLDGRLALSGSCDKTLRLWDLNSGKCVRTFRGHNAAANSATFSPDGRWVLSGGADNAVRLWDVHTSICLRTYEGHSGSVNSVAIPAHGQWALSASTDSTLRQWALGHGPAVHQVLSRPISSTDSTGFVRQVSDLKRTAQEALAEGRFLAAYDALEKALAVQGHARDSDLTDLRDRASASARISGHSVAYAVRKIDGHDSIKCVTVSDDGRMALAGHWHCLRLWDVHTGECLRTFEGHTLPVNSVALSSNGRWALSGGQDKTLRLWDLATGECLRTFKGHTEAVKSIAFSHDNSWALSGGYDNALRLWDLRTGTRLRRCERYAHTVRSVAISPDSRLALTGAEFFNKTDKSWDKRGLRLWEVRTGKCLRTLEGHSRGVNAVAFSPDGRMALSGSDDKTLRLWEVRGGKCLRTCEGHAAKVTSVAFIPDGRWALSAGYDNTLRLWDLQTGRCIRTLRGHTQWIYSVAMSGNGCWAVSGGEDCTLRSWRLVWDYEFPDPKDWDEGARLYLETFLTLHSPCGDDGVTRIGKPCWNDEDFKALLGELRRRGYGWLRPEGVRAKLEEMTANWTGQQSLGTSD